MAATAVQDKDLVQILDAFDNRELFRDMQGSAAFIRAGALESIAAGNTYQLGTLPFFLPIRHFLTERPIIFALIVIASVLLVLYLLWRAARTFAFHRRKELK